METKRCHKCLEVKPLGEFYRNCQNTDGLRTDCRACNRARYQDYYLRTRILKGKQFRGEDLTGRQFGRLTVMYRSGKDRQSKPVWKCRCVCGNEKEVRAKSLRAGHVQSCGCYQREVARRAVITAIGAVRLPFGVSAARCVIQRYKRDAAERGTDWDLPEEAAVALMQQPCFYCGIKPMQRATANKGHGFFLYNGIDRIDPKGAYTVSNTRPCCRRCNTAKLDMTQEEFKEWLKRAYSNLFRK